MISKELACRLAEGKTAYDKCVSANAISEANGGDIIFCGSDLAILGITEYIKNQCSKREQDLVIAFEGIERAYRMIHISFKVMKELPTKSDKEFVKMVYVALVNLGLSEFLCSEVEYADYIK